MALMLDVDCNDTDLTSFPYGNVIVKLHTCNLNYQKKSNEFVSKQGYNKI